MSPSLDPSLPRKLARRLAGRCCYGACATPALDGSDYCAPHDAHEKGRDRAKKKRRRLRLAESGCCICCGRKVGKRIRQGRPVQRRCRSCAKEHKVEARTARGVPDVSRGVPVDAPRTKVEIHADGYERTRYIGRGVRGQKSRSELDDDLRAELSWAIAELQWVRDEGIGALRSSRVAELGRIQRREAAAIVADRALGAVRVGESVAESLLPGRLAELRAVQREAVDDE